MSESHLPSNTANKVYGHAGVTLAEVVVVITSAIYFSSFGGDIFGHHESGEKRFDWWQSNVLKVCRDMLNAIGDDDSAVIQYESSHDILVTLMDIVFPRLKRG